MKPLFLILFFGLSGCYALSADAPPQLPTPCDRACEVLKNADCPEGAYTMCSHYQSNECMMKINVGCVMNAKSRKEIMDCNVKCEW